MPSFPTTAFAFVSDFAEDPGIGQPMTTTAFVGTNPSGLRGYGFESDSTFDFNWGAPGFGEPYKKALRESRSEFSITGFGEVLPR